MSSVPVAKTEWVTRRLSSSEHAHLIPLARIIASLNRNDDWAFPGQKWLAEKLNVSVRTVQRQCKQLEDLGVFVIRRTRPSRDKRTGKWHRRNTNRYAIRFSSRRTPSSNPPRRHQSRLYSPITHFGSSQEPAEQVKERLLGQANRLKALRAQI